MVRMETKIIYEDNHLLVVNKPAGELVQEDKSKDISVLEGYKSFLKSRDKKPGNVWLEAAHRLDRPVSGILILAKSSKILPRLNRLFQERKIKKTYLAVVENKPKKLQAELIHFLLKNRQKNITKAYVSEKKESKKAILSYEYLGAGNHKHLLRVFPKTGRSHQIRAQLSAINCPIVGDLKYGSPKGRGNFIYLHARSLEFIHPVKNEKIYLQAEVPNQTNWNIFKEFI